MEQNMKKCQGCKEMIEKEASKCKFCGQTQIGPIMLLFILVVFIVMVVGVMDFVLNK